MKNIAIARELGDNKLLAPRLGTDRLFPLPAGSFDYRGAFDDAIRFTEEYQLMDASLWKNFVEVFSVHADTKEATWKGEFWGKVMRGACMTYTYTQSTALLEVLTEAVRALLKTADTDGRISSYERDAEFRGWDVWCRKYVMLGLEHFYEICPEETLRIEVMDALCAQADYMLAHLGEGKLPVCETSHMWDGVNSSSVLEPVVRLYHITGAKKYLDFATHIVERGGGRYENIFETALENKKQPHEYKITKAYETISCFEGLLEYYRATGLEKWRKAAINFGMRVKESEVSVIGSCGCWHELFDHTVISQLSTAYAGLAQETCVSVTWMKFCLQLLCLTGESCFADEIEKSAYNALLGAVNFEKAAQCCALPFDSYSPLLPGKRAGQTGGKQMLGDGRIYGCCAAIGTAGTALVALSSVLQRADGVAVNLYIPGTVATFTPTGAPLEIAMKTNYPADGAISLCLDTTDEQPFVLALRIPAWSRMTTLAVNGQLVDVVQGSYVTLERVWKCGDRVELFLDMRTQVLSPEGDLPDENAQYHVALRRGPLILARDARLGGDISAPVSIVQDAEGYAVVERVQPPAFQPYYAFAVKQTDGSLLSMIDYASAGHTFDNQSLMCAWMPTKQYASFDLTRRFYLLDSAKAGGNTPIPDSMNPVCLLDGVMCSNCQDSPTVLQLCEEKDGAYRIKTERGYLTVNEEGLLVESERKGVRFTLLAQGLNRYAMSLSDGRLLSYYYTSKQKPIHLSDNEYVICKNIFILCNVEENNEY